MRHTRLISAAVGALFVASAAAGCSSDDVKKAAGDQVNKHADALKSKGAEMVKSKGADVLSGLSPEAKKKAADILGKLSPDAQKAIEDNLKTPGLKADVGSFKDAPTATLAEDYFAARQAALKSGDLSSVRTLVTPKLMKRTQRFVKRNAKRAGKPFVVKVVNVDPKTGTQVCVGPRGKQPRVVVVNAQGQVAGLRKGPQKCA